MDEILENLTQYFASKYNCTELGIYVCSYLNKGKITYLASKFDEITDLAKKNSLTSTTQFKQLYWASACPSRVRILSTPSTSKYMLLAIRLFCICTNSSLVWPSWGVIAKFRKDFSNNKVFVKILMSQMVYAVASMHLNQLFDAPNSGAFGN